MAIREVFGLFGTSIIAVIFLSLLLVIVVILLNIEKKLSKKLQVKDLDIERKAQLIRGIENIPNLDNRPERLIVYVDSYARRLFSEYLVPGKKIEYSQLAEHFTQKNQNDIASFCNEMTKNFYSGEKPGMDKIVKIVTDLKTIAEKYLLQGRHIQDIQPKLQDAPQIMKKPLPIPKQTTPSPSVEMKKQEMPSRPATEKKNNSPAYPIEISNQKMEDVKRRLLQRIQQEKLKADSPELRKKTLEQNREEKEEEAKLVEYKPKAIPPKPAQATIKPPQQVSQAKPRPRQFTRPVPQPNYSRPKREITIEDIDEIENLKAKIESMTQPKKRKG